MEGRKGATGPSSRATVVVVVVAVASAVVALVAGPPDVCAFAPTSSIDDVRGRRRRRRRRFVPPPSRAAPAPSPSTTAAAERPPTTAAEEDTDDETKSASAPPPLSETDARVLRSILSDDGLDFKTEENLKKLLERGAKKSKGSPTTSASASVGGGGAEARDDEGKKKYASKTVEKLSSKGFWNSLQAKAEALLDSARLYVTNRIERDAKVLGAVGLFAWDRAKRDVARALPSVATQAKRAVRTLAEKSSFEESVARKEEGEREDGARINEDAAGNGQRGVESASVYDEVVTPADELRSVSESLRDILSGTTTDSPETTTTWATTTTRGLKSVAPAGFANRSDRRRRAYRRQKETALKREKEGVETKIGRAASKVTDAAWEMKREMEAETNRAGYRTEGVRNAIEASAARAMLAAGAGEKGGWGQLPMGVGRTLFGGDDAGEAVVEDGNEPLELKAAEVEATTTTNRQVANEGIPTRRRPPIETTAAVVTEAVVVEAPAAVAAASASSVVVPPPPSMEIPTVAELLDERLKLASSLRSCLDAPDETWLVPDVVAASASRETSSVDDDALADAIGLMIAARDDWESGGDDDDDEDGGKRFFAMDEESALEELRNMKRTAEEVSTAVSRAAGEGAALRFEEELYRTRGEEEGDRSILLRSEATTEEARATEETAAADGAGPAAAAAARFAANGDAGDAPPPRRVVVPIDDVARASVVVVAPVAAEETPAIAVVAEGAAPEAAPEVLDAVVVATSSSSSSDVDDDAVATAEAEVDEETLPYDPADRTHAAEDVRDVAVVSTEGEEWAAPAARAATATNGGTFRVEGGTAATTDDVEAATAAAAAAAPLAVEVLTSDDELGETAFEAKAAVSVSEEEMAKEEDAKKRKYDDGEENVLVKAMLRALDVVFFVAEKTLTVALPGVLNAGSTFATRFEGVRRDGLGSKGWKRLANARSGAKRY